MTCGIIVFDDNGGMATEFPVKVWTPEIKFEPLYSNNGRLIQKGSVIPEKHGRLFIKSKLAKDIERNKLRSMHFTIGSMSEEASAEWLTNDCYFREDNSDRDDNLLVRVVMRFDGKDVDLYFDSTFRGEITRGEDKRDAIFMPFSTEPETEWLERLEEDREGTIKDLVSWNLYDVCYYGDELHFVEVFDKEWNGQ